MGHVSSEESPDERSDSVSGTSIRLELPIRDSELFKHGASSHVLNFLADNPDVDVSIRQLSKVIPMSERATREATDVLQANGLIETFHEGNARRVHIDRSKLDKPDDPIRSIPQTEYQAPVRIARRYIEDELDDVKGIILFGSVARGDADRQSDIDLWVLVGGDHMQQRHEANKLRTHLEGLKIPLTVSLADATEADFESNWPAIREQLEAEDQTWTSAQRHSFEIIVETPESIVGQSDRVDAQQLFSQGITLVPSETLKRVKMEVIGDE